MGPPEGGPQRVAGGGPVGVTGGGSAEGDPVHVSIIEVSGQARKLSPPFRRRLHSELPRRGSEGVPGARRAVPRWCPHGGRRGSPGDGPRRGVLGGV